MYFINLRIILYQVIVIFCSSKVVIPWSKRKVQFLQWQKFKGELFQNYLANFLRFPEIFSNFLILIKSVFFDVAFNVSIRQRFFVKSF